MLTPYHVCSLPITCAHHVIPTYYVCSLERRVTSSIRAPIYCHFSRWGKMEWGGYAAANAAASTAAATSPAATAAALVAYMIAVALVTSNRGGV